MTADTTTARIERLENVANTKKTVLVNALLSAESDRSVITRGTWG